MTKKTRIPYASWLIAERQRRGWTQADLARAAGLHPRTIYMVESGQTPRQATLQKIAAALQGHTPIVPENVDIPDSLAGDLDTALPGPGAAIASPANPENIPPDYPPG